MKFRMMAVFHFCRAAGKWAWSHRLPHLIVVAALGVGLWELYARTAASVLLVIDGRPVPCYTHQSTVGAFLQEMGVAIEAQDLVMPSPESPLAGGDTVNVQRARPFVIEADGEVWRVYSHAVSPNDLLKELGLQLGPGDQLLVDGQTVASEISVFANERPVHSAGLGSGTTLNNWSTVVPRPKPARVALRRAVPFYIHDGALEGMLYTTAPTIGQALLDHGITLYLGDHVSPSLGTHLSAGLHIYIKRSIPVELWADGKRIRTRTLVATVGDLLSQQGVALMGKDTVQPAEHTPIYEGLSVKVTRVRDEIVLEEETIPFETVWQPDPNLEIDQQQLVSSGKEGLTKRRLRLRYEDGELVAKAIEDEWVDRPPETKTIAYGTKIVLRELETPGGTVQYWRRIRMLATAYTAATSGKDRDHPAYGITRLGWKMRHGIVAVDPTVINLRTEVYVPGYGRGIAGDTGGLIIGRHIDLGFEEDDPEVYTWYRWVDVYLLAPAPPPDQIRYVLPNWPRERG